MIQAFCPRGVLGWNPTRGWCATTVTVCFVCAWKQACVCDWLGLLSSKLAVDQNGGQTDMLVVLLEFLCWKGSPQENAHVYAGTEERKYSWWRSYCWNSQGKSSNMSCCCTSILRSFRAFYDGWISATYAFLSIVYIGKAHCLLLYYCHDYVRALYCLLWKTMMPCLDIFVIWISVGQNYISLLNIVHLNIVYWAKCHLRNCLFKCVNLENWYVVYDKLRTHYIVVSIILVCMLCWCKPGLNCILGSDLCGTGTLALIWI